MNNTQKIILALGVGVGAAILYDRYKKGKTPFSSKPKGQEKKAQPTTASVSTNNSAISDLTRQEKEEFIIDNVSASANEIKSGFEGTRFVWNPTIGKMYPVGTIKEGKSPAYIENVFLSADGDIVTNIPNAVENAEASLKDLNDQEIDLAYKVVKNMSENPSISSEEEAVKDLGATNPNIILVVKNKLKKRLNDIKIFKKDASFKNRWSQRKQERQQKRAKFKSETGLSPNVFKKAVAKKCGRLKFFPAKHKKCVQSVAVEMRNAINGEIRQEVSNAPISEKQTISNIRQANFANQMTNRSSGGMFAGHRWDGESNRYVESKVDAGIV